MTARSPGTEGGTDTITTLGSHVRLVYQVERQLKPWHLNRWFEVGSEQRRQEWFGIISSPDGHRLIHDRDGRIHETTWDAFTAPVSSSSGRARIEWIHHPPGHRSANQVVDRARSCIGHSSQEYRKAGSNFAEWCNVGDDIQSTGHTNQRMITLGDSCSRLPEWASRHFNEIQTVGWIGMVSGLLLLSLDKLQNLELERDQDTELLDNNNEDHQ